jgi:intracellular septation protein A
MTAMRRKAILFAALCAILGGFIAFDLHGHRWIAFACIGAQAILLVTALSLFVRSNRPGSTRRDSARPQ